jgi:hypothetical protein
LEKFKFFAKRVGLFLVMIALITAMGGCIFGNSSQTVEIRTWYDLDGIRSNLSADYILMNDLDSTTAGYDELAGPTANDGKGWHPIGGPGSSGDGPPFTGTLNGQGHKISDVFIDLPGTGYVALLSIVGEGGRVESIGVVNADVTSTAYIGVLVGINRGTVSYSYSTGSLTGEYYSGGLVGQNDGAVSNAYSTCDVTSDSGAGGLMGANTGTVSNTYSTGNVTGDSGAGGLVAANSGTVTNSYSTGSVSANEYVGGLVGYSEEGTVSGSFWDMESSGQSTSDGGTGKTTTEMKSIGTFSSAGWNIIAVADLGTRNTAYIWNMVTGVTYPFFSLQS